ncbi:bile acid:sodium symporter [Halodesulfovibrio aestuarii]|uniref:bile acid:sodium symporter n=1 Tax=Halodesulfovibrio aestuarii TaxID=126333 RepID=UPI003D356F15
MKFQKILELGNKKLLLLGVLIAIVLGVHFPLSQEILHAFHFTTLLVAIIFIAQGLNMDFSQAINIKKHFKIMMAGTIIAVFAYPALAYEFTRIFSLANDFALGFILICCFPNSLEAAMAMTMSANGNRVTAVVLLTGLCLVGIFSIPFNIYIWVGGTEHISASTVLAKVIGYVFLPVSVGQLLRKFFPRLPEQTKRISHYLPILCLSALVYISCSREASILDELSFSDIVHTLFPSASLHLLMLVIAVLVGRYILHLSKEDNRSFIFITSEKPMSLSVALWSVTYAPAHPTSIFPILIFYLAQMIIDSFIISRLKLQDYAKTG